MWSSTAGRQPVNFTISTGSLAQQPDFASNSIYSWSGGRRHPDHPHHYRRCTAAAAAAAAARSSVCLSARRRRRPRQRRPARTARTEPLRARAAIRGAASAAGGANHTQPPPRELLIAQSDAHVEYERAARLPVVGGAARLAACSRSEEDVQSSTQTEEHTAWRWPRHMCV